MCRAPLPDLESPASRLGPRSWFAGWVHPSVPILIYRSLTTSSACQHARNGEPKSRWTRRADTSWLEHSLESLWTVPIESNEGLMRRGFRLLLVLILVVAAAGVGWVAGSQIKSPAQVAAEAEPPEPSVISVPVQLTVISNDIITRGTARFEDPQPVLASEVILPGVDPVITMMPEVGDTLEEGDVLYELAGRPTFILRGDLPLFRSAQHRDEGEDIAQLQEALTRLGFFDRGIDGKYGSATQRAVVDFYESNGYEAYRPAGQSRYPLVKSEFAFFESLPIRVDQTSGGRGDIAGGEIMRVSGSRLTIDSSVNAQDAGLVNAGDKVTIDHQLLGIEITGTVTFKADGPGTNEVPPEKVYLEITPDEVVAELNFANVRIVIPVTARSTQGEVLAVPAAALSATGSGETIVTVLEDDETTRVVVVIPGLATASGLVEVTAVNGDLDESDWVVVGFEQREQ